MHRYLIILSFLIVISLPLILTILKVDLFSENNENRKLATVPKISFKNTKKLQNLKGLNKDFTLNIEKYNTYFSDGFILKQDLFRLYVKIKSTLFKTNPLPHKVVEGKDGWMFIGDSFSNAIVSSKGILNFNKNELQQMKNNLNTWKSWFLKNKIDFYIAIPPNKLTLYGEKLPIINDINNNKKTEQLKFLCDSLNINHLDMLNDNYTNERLYLKTDTHWNDKGAYLAYQNLISLIQKDYPIINIIPLDSFDAKKKVYWNRDLVKMLSKKVKENAFSYKIRNSYTKELEKKLPIPKNNSKNPNNYEKRFKSNVNDLKVLIFRDSFSNALIKYIKESFGESVFIRDNMLNKEIIKTEKPDIVIAICVERRIDLFKSNEILENP